MGVDLDRIEKSTRQLRKALKEQPGNPTADEIHDMRTHTRRLEAAVEALALADRHNERRLLKGLHGLRKRTGKIRDMDVFTGHAITVKVSEDERDCLVRLLESLGAERHRHVTKLRGRMRADGTTLRWRLKRTFDHISAAQANGSSSASDAFQEAAALALRLSASLAEPRRLNKSNLHPYRLKVKELRYVLQMAARPEDTIINELGKVKDAIGEWHDWEELVSIASELNTHGPKCTLVQELKHIAEKQYERALVLTNRTRREHLLSRGRDGAAASPDAIHPSPPMLAAAVGLADRR